MRRATDAERERLHETFAALCRIESPSGRERACADWVAGELRGMGLHVEEDDAGPRVGSDAGNLLARIPGAGGPGSASILLCAHLDTVPLTAPLEPVLVDGGWTNAGEGILGADNKTAVAVMLELARRLSAGGGADDGAGSPRVGVELLFTVCEEISLLGAREFDVTRLRSEFGYVFDHATPIGEIVLAAPTLHRMLAEFRGRAAHAGVRPEDGRSAIAAAARAIASMQLGRLDPETTANVGTIAGGTAINVVPERCRIEAEVRSVDQARAAETIATEMIDHMQDAADAAECDLDVTVERMIQGYRVRPRATPVTVAEEALRACGYEPTHIITGGASDANAFQAAGFSCINLADGTEHNHEPTERISVDALEGMLEVAIALVDQAGQALGGGAVSAEFEETGSDVAWEGKIVRAGVERFRYADGTEVTRDKVWHPGAVGILPLDDRQVWLTRQPREAIGDAASLEIPAGKLDVPGEPPLETAKRELAEEIGKRAEQWDELFVFYTSPGFSDERVWVYLATDLSEAPEPGEAEEDERIEIVPWPLDRLDEAIAECADAKSLIALLWLAGRRPSR